jgi:hypothetical protein
VSVVVVVHILAVPVFLHHLVDERVNIAWIEVVLPDPSQDLLKLVGSQEDVAMIRRIGEIEGTAAALFRGLSEILGEVLSHGGSVLGQGLRFILQSVCLTEEVTAQETGQCRAGRALRGCFG